MKSLKNLIFILIIAIPGQIYSQYSKTEQKIGFSTYKMVESTSGFYKNEKLLNVVKVIGQQLEQQLDKDYDFKYYLIDSQEPNAFATAGGYVFVTRGLLAIVNTRDELAGILSHEFQHVTNKHVSKKIGASIAPVILELPANIIGLLTHKEFAEIINFPIEETSKLAINAYTRSQEMEADKKGIDIAIKAGFNPYGLPSALKNLTDFIEYSTGQQMKRSLFIDHPITADRIKYLTEIIREKGVENEVPVYEGAKIPEAEGLVFGQNPKAGLINDNIFIHPDINLYCEFPKEWLIQNSAISVSAVSPDKKSTIVLSIDSASNSPSEAARRSIKKLHKSNLVLIDSSDVNEFKAYKVYVRARRIKYNDYLTEIMWLKAPGSKYLLKVAGVTDYFFPDENISNSYNTFRPLTGNDLKQYSQATLSMLLMYENVNIKDYLMKQIASEKAVEFFLKLNGVSPDQKINIGNYFKVIKETELIKHQN